MKPCDNVSEAHDMVDIAEDTNAIRVFCKVCKTQFIVRKDLNKGNPEKKQYAKLFKRWIMQGNDNLFYKYHPEYLKQ